MWRVCGRKTHSTWAETPAAAAIAARAKTAFIVGLVVLGCVGGSGEKRLLLMAAVDLETSCLYLFLNLDL